MKLYILATAKVSGEEKQNKTKHNTEEHSLLGHG